MTVYCSVTSDLTDREHVTCTLIFTLLHISMLLFKKICLFMFTGILINRTLGVCVCVSVRVSVSVSVRACVCLRERN